MKREIRPIAIYLPQFHPIPENDKAWGEGFTEWTNVRKARPLFRGHYQPHVPHDLIGYYDLRDPEVLVKQASLAKEHGIYGFGYYHYWFNGKRLLNTPLDNMLETGKPDFPFFLIWANENWTKRWDGMDHEIIIKQEYSFEDDLQHIRMLLPFFADPRYIRVNNKPVFVIYRTELFPDMKRTAEIWREEAIKAGVGDLYLIRAENFTQGIIPESIGFDASFDFQPSWQSKAPPYRGGLLSRLLHRTGMKNSPYKTHYVSSYEDFILYQLSKPDAAPYKKFPGITPMWDNYARKKSSAFILSHSTPMLYKKWLNQIVASFEAYSAEENFIFINAWNEWAEGNHLEPCKKWGTAYLEATAEVFRNA